MRASNVSLDHRTSLPIHSIEAGLDHSVLNPALFLVWWSRAVTLHPDVSLEPNGDVCFGPGSVQPMVMVRLAALTSKRAHRRLMCWKLLLHRGFGSALNPSESRARSRCELGPDVMALNLSLMRN